eukprot:1139984-Pelagomonas_calceolata.AAC.3
MQSEGARCWKRCVCGSFCTAGRHSLICPLVETAATRAVCLSNVVRTHAPSTSTLARWAWHYAAEAREVLKVHRGGPIGFIACQQQGG